MTVHNNRGATPAQRQAVLAAIDKAEREMLPGGLTAEEIEMANVIADEAVNEAKNTGALHRFEAARAYRAEVEAGALE